MATPVVMPKLGNTVESCIIVNWKKHPGDSVAPGDILLEVETDKATQEIDSPAAGILLELFFNEGDDVPVMTNIAAIGEPGENVAALRPGSAPHHTEPAPAKAAPAATRANNHQTSSQSTVNSNQAISPRARNLARQQGLEVNGLQGTGPGGRIIERDIRAALERQPAMTPLARSMLASGEFVAPPAGTGARGRITTKDLQPTQAVPEAARPAPQMDDDVQTIPVKGTRRIIAERMLNSLQTTAQLTMNASADARALLDYRKRLKASDAALDLQKVTINDLVLLAVSRVLPQFPNLNALFTGDSIMQYKAVHLGFAVDTPRGLIVPVIRSAHRLSLRQLSKEAGQLAAACQDSKVAPDDLAGATFTVTNLGSLGVESFTPVLNPPQVAILGVGNIQLKPIETDGGIEFIPHLGLSLTINHQVVDGAPGARFLQALCKHLANIDVLLAL